MKAWQKWIAALGFLIAITLVYGGCASRGPGGGGGGGPIEPPAPPVAPLHVSVYDAATGAPVANARIDISAIDGDDDGRTSETGYWAHHFLLLTPPDTYRLEVHAEGYTSHGQDVAFTQETNVDVKLQKPPPPLVGRRGVPRVCGHTICDDDGNAPWLGATLFWALSGYRHDRALLDDNLAWIKHELGADYVRILAVVGGGDITPDPWSDAGAFLSWPDWDATLAGFVDYAYDRYGLRTQITVFGGRAQAPSLQQQLAVADRVTAIVRARPHKVFLVETVNEYWMNYGWNDEHPNLRHLTRHLRATLPRHFPLAISSTRCAAEGCPEHEAQEEFDALYGGDSGANVWTPHWSREVRLVDGVWRFVRQPWDGRAFDGPAVTTSNEPMGPVSSVAQDDNPSTIAAAYVSSILTGQAGYVFHADALIWSCKLNPAYHHLGYGKYCRVSEHRNAPQIAAALKAVRTTLPGELPNYTRTRHGFQDHPFIGSFGCGQHCAQIWPDGHERTGVVRIFAAHAGAEFYAQPIGIRAPVRLTPTRAVTFDVLTPWMQPIASVALAPGETFTLGSEHEWVLIRGRYR